MIKIALLVRNIKGMKELEVTLKAKDELYTILKDDESIKSVRLKI
ncbi:MAG: hypothetical protein ACLTGX_10625 [Clostridium sp.]